jgi:hypothetical protein
MRLPMLHEARQAQPLMGGSGDKKDPLMSCISACECRLEAGNHDVEEIGCFRRIGWRYRDGLDQRQAVAGEQLASLGLLCEPL